MGSIYYLNNGDEGWESNRLDRNHHDMIVPLLGNTLLPPEIKKDLVSKPYPMIADICTGTGVWAISVAKELPQAQVRGFDIDTSKFTPTLPPHVQLQYGDVFSPFPSELLGTFDLVHARLLVCVLKTEDWVPVIRNLMTLLWPGGWILWEDSGPFEFRVLPITPGWVKYTNLSWRFCSANSMDLKMPATLATHIRNAGFVDVMQKEFHTSPEEKLNRNTGDCMLRLAYQSFLGMVASGKMEDMKTEEQAKAAVEEIRKEFEQGGFCFWMMNSVWGRVRPLPSL